MGRGRRLFAASALVATFAASVAVARTAPQATVPTGVYAGTVGDGHVTLQLGTNADFLIDGTVAGRVTCARPITGTYFYDRVGIGIYLGGCVLSDGRIELDEIHAKDADNGKSASDAKHWQLSPTLRGFSGAWNRGKTSYAVTLVKIAPYVRAGRYDDSARAYRSRLKVRSLRNGALVNAAPRLSYRTVTDVRYDLSTIQLVDSAEPHARERANRTLLDDLDARASDAYDCLTNLAYNFGDAGPPYGLKTRVAFISSKVASIDVRGEVDCASASPSYVVDPITIDLRDGEKVDWGAAVVAPLRMTAAYRARIIGVPPTCKDSGVQAILKALPSTEYSFEIRPGGLETYGHLPHVIAACANDVLIPMPLARTMLAPAYRELLP